MSVDAVCFVLERTPRMRRWLRRFTYSINKKCPGDVSGHDASVLLDELDVPGDERPHWEASSYPLENYPAKCEHCDYIFTPEDERQVFSDWLWRDTRNGKLVTIEEADIGAMWHAWWDTPTPQWNPLGPDGMSLVVKLPGGFPWAVDGPCSNCTRPDDRGQLQHKCWPRQGIVPKITVSKKFGPTCSAGAGSVQGRNYHGFLVDGCLTQSAPP